jgi:hypothetical protein
MRTHGAPRSLNNPQILGDRGTNPAHPGASSTLGPTTRRSVCSAPAWTVVAHLRDHNGRARPNIRTLRALPPLPIALPLPPVPLPQQHLRVRTLVDRRHTRYRRGRPVGQRRAERLTERLASRLTVDHQETALGHHGYPPGRGVSGGQPREKGHPKAA